jgi:hypothetical protein
MERLVNRLIAVVAALTAFSPAITVAGPIQDNSFLIEEAYNQEPGVIQHISTFNRSVVTGAWAYSFTEEWPILGQTHQGSVTLNYADLRKPNARGIGDVLLNYRWQAVGSGETSVALAPRFTVVLPTGDAERGLGGGGAGVEVNLPLSIVLADRVVSHVNLGGRYVPGAQTELGSAKLANFSVGQSFIWLAHSKLNFMVETLYTSTDIAARDASSHSASLTVNPGLRAAVDVGGLQIVPGVAFPVGIGPSRGENGVFFYLSFEHPFRLAGPQDERS